MQMTIKDWEKFPVAPGAPSFCTKSTPANNKILCNLTNAKFKISIDKYLEM